MTALPVIPLITQVPLDPVANAAIVLEPSFGLALVFATAAVLVVLGASISFRRGGEAFRQIDVRPSMDPRQPFPAQS